MLGNVPGNHTAADDNFLPLICQHQGKCADCDRLRPHCRVPSTAWQTSLQRGANASLWEIGCNACTAGSNSDSHGFWDRGVGHAVCAAVGAAYDYIALHEIVRVFGFITHVTVFTVASVTESVDNCIEPLFSALLE